jgi:hypothetical protein
MGGGLMTFETVPGWGLGEDGKSVLGATHGGVVIDKAGNVYVSASKGVVVFSPDGKVLREFVHDDHSNLHDIEIREEEVLSTSTCPEQNREGIKFRADMERSSALPFPKASGRTHWIISPTAITVLHETSFCDGYASMSFRSTTKYLSIGRTND